MKFVSEVARIDALEFENTPGFALSRGEILRVELFSVPLNGLSQLDFRLALKINEMDPLKNYQLMRLESEDNLKQQIKQLKAQHSLESARKYI